MVEMFPYPNERWEPWQRPSVQITAGSTHVRDEDPPEDWTPPAPVGFAPTPRTDDHHNDQAAEPQLWEGDSA